MKEQVKLSVFYPHPPQRVWQALTDRRALATWMMKNDFEPKLGHKFRFEHSLPRLQVIDCEVVELEAPKRLAYTWQDITGLTLVIWTLTPVEGGTQLQLTHQKSSFAVTVQESQQLETEFVRNTFLYESSASPSTLTNFNLPLFNSLKLEAVNHWVVDLATEEAWEYRLTQKLMEMLQKKMNEQTFIDSSDRPWNDLELFPGTQIFPLAEPVPQGSIHRLGMKAGTIIPVHSHPSDEYVYVLSGTIVTNGRRCHSGTFWFTPANAQNGPHQAVTDVELLTIRLGAIGVFETLPT